IETATALVKPAASAGIDTEFLQHLHVSIDPTVPAGQGLVGTALRDRQSMVSNDIRHDPRLKLWRAAFLQRGYRSAFVLPLMTAQEPFGVLALFSDQTNAFNEDEQRLLSELAADISFAHEFIDKEEQINYLAFFDSLTGLPNRALFLDRLSSLLAIDATSNAPFAVVLIDVERFRRINDSFGRAAGDEMLRVVARRLRDCLPDAGYLGRISADSFAFMIRSERDETDVLRLLDEEVICALSEPILVRDKSVRLSVRAGIAMFPNDGIDSDSLLRNAEAALKDAKTAKARHLFYTAEMNERTAEKLALENRLRHALEADQFVLHYQPKVDLQSGEIVGMEALIRWDEPGVGLMSPLSFIHVLEDTGMIVDVGIWVIARAHAQYQAWQAAGLVVPRIAVNVSQMQIRQKDFVTRVLGILDANASTQLELEITESLFMDDTDPNASRGKLSAMREVGLTVAIDDFGTGYSSLSYLAQLPIDTLKIDRSFITGMTTSNEHMAIVSTIISLAHALKLKVVAEGVETVDQREQLKQLGCEQMQGFLFSAGLPADEMAAMLRRI
ncbi:MAG: EAL domain-containing protein, partial [Pseudomonadota bacterium]|nr:EAL domain-containing protein [Pseudomonadota bacterium]